MRAMVYEGITGWSSLPHMVSHSSTRGITVFTQEENIFFSDTRIIVSMKELRLGSRTFSMTHQHTHTHIHTYIHKHARLLFFCVPGKYEALGDVPEGVGRVLLPRGLDGDPRGSSDLQGQPGQGAHLSPFPQQGSPHRVRRFRR